MTPYWDVICRRAVNAFVVTNLGNMAKTIKVVNYGVQDIRNKYVEGHGETQFID